MKVGLVHCEMKEGGGKGVLGLRSASEGQQKSVQR